MVFRVLYMSKISEEIVSHFPTGGYHAPTGGYSPPLAPPLYVQETFLVSLTSKSTPMPRIFLHKNTFLVHLLNSLGSNSRY